MEDQEELLNNILAQINTYIQNNPNGAFGQLRDVHDILTLDFAIDNRHYYYWLQDEAVRYAVRAHNDIICHMIKIIYCLTVVIR